MTANVKTVQIDSDFPGGNIVVEKIDGNTVYLHQDLRDTEGNWLYWHFRVTGAAGERLTFRFNPEFRLYSQPVISSFGPALSTDSGQTWRWLGHQVTDEDSFTCDFPADCDEAFLCVSIPYLQKDLQAFINKQNGNPALRKETLCLSRKKREVELLYLQENKGASDCDIVLTCRHHCCEMIASHLLEGIMDYYLNSEQPTARWLREHARIIAVPFVDKDGVEDGDQGKNRRPHDHNRDYFDDGIYAETTHIRKLMSGLSRIPKIHLDLHGPCLRDKNSEHIFLIESPYESVRKEQRQFSEILEKVPGLALPYRADGNCKWATIHQGIPKTSTTWFANELKVPLSATIETPYANVSGTEVTQTSALGFGGNVADAIGRYLQEK